MVIKNLFFCTKKRYFCIKYRKMMTYQTIQEIKQQFPDEWILLDFDRYFVSIS
ncbi:MAG: hypothetical protein U5L45_13225 [Saprospiraceae bacterium]|nr:hypothetical protein [Saprospiraceae bacterium]